MNTIQLPRTAIKTSLKLAPMIQTIVNEGTRIHFFALTSQGTIRFMVSNLNDSSEAVEFGKKK